MSKIIGLILIAALMMVVVLGITLLLALPTMYLWNWLVPQLFHGPNITFWQTLGLMVLARFVLGTGHNSSSSKKD